MTRPWHVGLQINGTAHHETIVTRSPLLALHVLADRLGVELHDAEEFAVTPGEDRQLSLAEPELPLFGATRPS